MNEYYAGYDFSRHTRGVQDILFKEQAKLQNLKGSWLRRAISSAIIVATEKTRGMCEDIGRIWKSP